MEGHNIKTGDMLRQLDHVLHSLLPKVADPVVRENYRRTGVLTPAQVHGNWYKILEENPHGKFLDERFFENFTLPSTISPILISFSVTMAQLVRGKDFNDLNHHKLVFSFGGGTTSTRQGALFKCLQVNYFYTDYRTIKCF